MQQDGVYFQLGQLIAMALLHGGAGVRILSPSVFNFLSGMKPSDIIVGIDEIADTDVKVILKKVFTIYKCNILYFSTVKVLPHFCKVVDFQFATRSISSTVSTIYVDCRNKLINKLLIPPSHFARYLTLQSVNYVIHM